MPHTTEELKVALIRLKRLKHDVAESLLGRMIDRAPMSYHQYLASPQWEQKRQWLFKHRGRRCEECGNEGCEMHVHHLTYERLGNEKSTDLKIVCVYCHQYIHGNGPEVTHISEGLSDLLTSMP